ncbi:MAG: PaaI family thioesterase [Desulfobacterales bacterium]
MDKEIEKFLNAWRSGEISPSPSAALIGTKILNFENGSADINLTLSEPHLNSSGTVQGGILCSLADVAMGTAVFTKIEKGDRFTTTNLNAMFYQPATSGKLLAAARVVYPGKTLMHTECDITADGRMVAKMSATFAIKKAGI